MFYNLFNVFLTIGTGKTHLLVYMIEHFLAYKGETTRPRVFYCAPTDSAVDEMARRLLTFRERLPENNKFKRKFSSKDDALNMINSYL